jgi:hypothetical protein
LPMISCNRVLSPSEGVELAALFVGQFTAPMALNMAMGNRHGTAHHRYDRPGVHNPRAPLRDHRLGHPRKACPPHAPRTTAHAYRQGPMPGPWDSHRDPFGLLIPGQHSVMPLAHGLSGWRHAHPLQGSCPVPAKAAGDCPCPDCREKPGAIMLVPGPIPPPTHSRDVPYPGLSIDFLVPVAGDGCRLCFCAGTEPP